MGVHERSTSVDNLLPAVDEVDSSGGGGYEGGGGGVNLVAQPPEGARVPPGRIHNAKFPLEAFINNVRTNCSVQSTMTFTFQNYPTFDEEVNRKKRKYRRA